MITLNLVIGLVIGFGAGTYKAHHAWRDMLDTDEDKEKAPAAATAGAQEQNNIFNDYSLPRLDVDEKRVA
ncbi:hypothetical protein [Lacticaseibacillus nasuensis]|uniref:Uncharacterized protein n=1 Tax=Lacticaseibacillus nasuensis JCM 17158 TaxID=1291734 RepID=A0A0R1JL01_9LACO|nr:hypothetical protein [Lacticaseibacillus nasuensis]KRK71884.1 hypothetical protein FD02_GL002133 [Lacticaseibacillus nasuensis JCM 17158]